MQDPLMPRLPPPPPHSPYHSRTYPSPKSLHLTMPEPKPQSLGYGLHRNEPYHTPPQLHHHHAHPHQQRPPMRAAHSSYAQEMPSPEDKEELTTKGRKRKRLAKACSACHKNKRRCDGFAPCSNCEFSSRPCLYLNAQGEPIPPPRSRELTGSTRKDDIPLHPDSSSNKRSSTSPHQPGGSGEWRELELRGETERRGYIDPIEAVERDPGLSAELIEIFLHQLQPYSAMFHPPTFHHRLYLSRISPLLLDVIYAFSSRYSTNPQFLQTFTPSTPIHLRGEIFAERANIAARRLVEVRSTWTDEERRSDKGTWDETEFAQATFLLAVYFLCMRQPQLSAIHFETALSILRPSSSSSSSSSAASAASTTSSSTMINSRLPGMSSTDHLTLIETRHRTFWLIVMHDLCSSAYGRPRRISDGVMYNVPLPGNEVWWARFGGGDGGRRDGLIVGSGNWAGEDGAVGELGHVIRILSIFSEIMVAANSDGRTGSVMQHEQALKSWASTLPPHLRFDESTLSLALIKLASPVASISLSGWLYTYMHALAECGMFYLQAAIASSSTERWTAHRQSQAVDNLVVLLDSVGEKGRASPQMFFPMYVVANWQDHLRSTTPLSPQSTLLDEKLILWWGDAKRDWGMERGQLLEYGYYTPPTPYHPSPRRFEHPPQPPSSTLGLYQTTSPTQPTPDSMTSTSTSTMTLPTPSFRHPYTQLPPLRPRATSGSTFVKSPISPSWPPFSAFSDHADGGRQGNGKERVELAPMERFVPYYRGRDDALERERDRDRERERERQRERDREREREREKARERVRALDVPLGRPRAQTDITNGSGWRGASPLGKGVWLELDKVDEAHRAMSRNGDRKEIGIDVERGREKAKQDENEIAEVKEEVKEKARELSGIEALVSAAEVREKESVAGRGGVEGDQGMDVEV